jgi:diguanylate cyclase (GGDEF)-like protein
MIDLNKFKQINDRYGHVEGDYALKRTADALKAACTDNTLKTFIARYGGDEFIIITKTENEDLVKELCSDIKAALIRLNNEAGAEYELTASIGYSAIAVTSLLFRQPWQKLMRLCIWINNQVSRHKTDKRTVYSLKFSLV